MEQREKLIELLSEYHSGNYDEAQRIADYLIANGVVVLPCRCCECEYQQECKNAQYFGLNGFCSIGKRKGGDE